MSIYNADEEVVFPLRMGGFKKIKLTEKSRYFTHRDEFVADDYASGLLTTEQVADKYGLSVRSVQRIARNMGVVRSVSASNKLMAKFKDYSGMRKKPEDKAKRKHISAKLRWELIKACPRCVACGAASIDKPLHIDHIDNDPTNNELSNLQVLCIDCNHGKYRSYLASKEKK